MIAKNFLVSIIMPAYNAERYIKEAIESVLNQTYKNIEIIVINDGSTDNTEEILRPYFKNKIIRYYKQQNAGIGAARNYAIKLSNGKFITFLDADDIYLPEKVEAEAEVLARFCDYGIVYCNLKHFFDGKPDKLLQHQYDFQSGDVFRELLKRDFINPTSVMIRKEVIDRFGSFDSAMRHAEDWDLWLRLSYQGVKFYFLDKDLVRARISGSSLSNLNNQWDMKEHALRLFKKLFVRMNLDEKKRYDETGIMSKLRLKAALAHLAAGHKKEFRFYIFEVHKNFLWKIFAGFFVFLTFFMPSDFLKTVVQKIWRLKQRLLFRYSN